MPILSAYIVPHPPLIIPSVGRGEEKIIQATADGLRAIAKDIAERAPDTLVILSPHATAYADYFHISPGKAARGDLAKFGSPAAYRCPYDTELIRTLCLLCAEEGFPAGTDGEREPSLDHGTIVPLHFIQEACPASRIVRIGISGLSLEEHYRFGLMIREAADRLGRKTAVVASGDLSHKLKADGPYGFSPDGPKLDSALAALMRSADFGGFFRLDATLRENAAECGLRGFAVMAGALDRLAVTPTLHSYEGPLGVGYAVASFIVRGGDASRGFLETAEAEAAARIGRIRGGEDPYAALARETLERFVRSGKRMQVPEGLPPEMTARRAGVFVSIKKHGELRGCIGTTEPTRDSVAEEIIRNAIASGNEDPRFPPVRESELPDLVYSVDVLSPAEPVSDKSALDEKRYGVIVSSGARRGLLLPNLEGVDSVDEQLAIACRKAGIDPSRRYAIERFEVARHS